MFFDLASTSWDDDEVNAIKSVIESNRYTMGPKVAEFEKKFASYFSKKYAVMVNSGSSANLISVASLFYKKDKPLQRGDEVIVPAIAWATTYHPLQQYGLKMLIVDVDLNTLNIDVSQLEDALTPNTRMIVGVSILGNPAALDVMRNFADKHGLYFLEDNCESADAELKGRKTGTFGDLNTFSFFFSHHISTMEGGMILTDDEELYHLTLSMRAHGWTRDLPKGSSIYETHDNDFFEAYRFILPGYNVRPAEMSGAIGLRQIKKLPAMTETRRENLAIFQDFFANDERFIIQTENGKSSAFSFPIILNPEKNLDRERVFSSLRNADIGYRMITGGNILRHDVIRHYDFEEVNRVINADIAHDHGFFVGNHPKNLSPQIETLWQVLDKACS
jgi:CDP-6-deoxy-D-xylo-4-hexulose-3-dehydrase